MRHFPWSPLIVASVLAAAVATASTDPPSALPSQGVENVEVVLRQLDFLAVDRTGRPVTDLRADEVRLEDEGLRRPIVDFLAASGSVCTNPPCPPAPPPQTPGSREGAPQASATQIPAPRWIVVYFDARNLSLPGRIRAGRALRAVVETSFRSNDRVALMVDDGDVRVVLPFGRQREELLRLLDRADGLTATQRDLETRLKALQENAEGCREVSNITACARQSVDAFLLETSRETEQTLENLESLIRGLGAIPERKILLYVSDGFLLNPGDVASAAVEHAIGQINYNLNAMRMLLSRDYSHRIERIFQLASVARVGFYPINTLRRMNDDAFAPERRFDSGPENLAQARSDQFEASWQQVFNTQTGLALATGGAAIFRRDPMGEIDRQLRTTTGIYTVTYQLPFLPTGRRKVKLECTRRGVKLIYRDRYEFQPTEAVRAEGRLAVNTEDYGRNGGIVRAEVDVAAADFRELKEVQPPTIFAALYFQVSDAGLRVLQEHHEIVTVPRPALDAGSATFRRPFAVRVPPGEYALRVEIRDVNGPAWASLRTEFRVGEVGNPPEAARAPSESRTP